MCEYSYGRGAPNKVFRVKSKGMTDSTPEIKKLPIGDALETEGHGTGGAVADLNGDGVLDLLLSHGESTASQALELYRLFDFFGHVLYFLKIRPQPSKGPCEILIFPLYPIFPLFSTNYI